MAIDSSALSPAEATQLVEAAGFFAHPVETAIAASPGSADFQQQSITVENENQQHTVHLSDLSAKSPAMKSLLQFIESKAKELQKTSLRKSP